jgi:hypothetical protein
MPPMSTLADYYAAKWGQPSTEAEFIAPGGARIEIWKWTAEQTTEGITMYATLGASAVLGDERASCEFFIGLIPEADDIAPALAEIGLEGNGTGGVPASGDTLAALWRLALPSFPSG